MSDIGEALGAAAEGALLAGAIEPKTGANSAIGADGHTHEDTCLNCGTELIGPHCHGCGQRGHVHRTIGAFFHDLLHGVLHFEGKTWHTLPLLAWRPGELTRRYIAGERAKFVSPMALFLFSVFVMFAVFQVVGIAPPDKFGGPVNLGRDASSAEQIEGQLTGLRAAREELADSNPAAPFLDGQIEDLEERLERAEAEEGAASDGESSAPAVETEAASNPPSPPAAAAAVESGPGFGDIRTGWALLDHGIEKWRENPGLMAYKLQANSYKFSWLLIPLSIPFVWLLFAWRRRFGAYDHAVFVTYSLCFMTLLFVAEAVIGQVPGTGAVLFFATTLIPPIHIYKQLKGAYGLSRLSAFWRTMVLLVFVFVILLLFVSLLLALGALG